MIKPYAKYIIFAVIMCCLCGIGAIGFAMPFTGDSYGNDNRSRINEYIHRIVYAGDKDGFTTGGKEPKHSWTNSFDPNEHARIFDDSGNPITPLDTGPGQIVYDDLNTRSPGSADNPFGCLTPALSVCLKNAMAQQIHALVNNYNAALILMTEQFSAVNMQFVQIIGSFFDASNQFETQRLFRSSVARAHKDYHPSIKMCEFGTMTRGLTDAEERINSNIIGLNGVLNGYYTAEKGVLTAEGEAKDNRERINKYKTVYCNKHDLNGSVGDICERQDNPTDPDYGDPARINIDIDYIRSLDLPLTLNINFAEFVDGDGVTDNEQDLIALARHLYWTDALSFEDPDQIAKKKTEFPDIRNLIAVQNVAHNSFATIAALKARAQSVLPADEPDTAGHYMVNVLESLGMSESAAKDVLGENPSYYAAMEVLTNLIYQDPDFYTHLYDKPANVKRMAVTLDAIKLMHGRDRYESALRREMLTSLLVEEEIRKKAIDLNDRIQFINATN